MVIYNVLVKTAEVCNALLGSKSFFSFEISQQFVPRPQQRHGAFELRGRNFGRVHSAASKPFWCLTAAKNTPVNVQNEVGVKLLRYTRVRALLVPGPTCGHGRRGARDHVRRLWRLPAPGLRLRLWKHACHLWRR
eukprot:3221149-Rhodomonas_salina.3